MIIKMEDFMNEGNKLFTPTRLQFNDQMQEQKNKLLDKIS